ncbi:hypothetical protein RMN57_28190 [Kitasatospora sp. CM 4170]|uniref:Uncharacterized protein n=1 Tax=Kitasatospora aburaviensis TaxID=67265 RepID=A0ABW1F603_9ACTN|nr:hypothetical protein [Kitasatospora sp. CM 4170]WNM48288.1 hypothetical protein RMN57_28190 [Kitasatospora sp. CM 4170]
MRPSYDAENPHSTTPIYDELYSEYRRLFRALPGDRSGEENLKFTGFAVRDGYPLFGEPRSYPPQQQSFQTYAGQALGLPQFMPSQQTGPGVAGHTTHGGHTSHGGTSHPGASPAHPGASPAHTGGAPAHTGGATHTGAAPYAAPTAPGAHPADPTSDGTGHSAPADRHLAHAQSHPAPSPHTQPTGHGGPTPPGGQPSQPTGQFANGQGWVAAGYLGPVPHPIPAPAPSPAPVVDTGAGATAGPATGGRHRNLLSLPPGRSGDQH